MRILSITAGAASMYCGSCLRDNALAAELMARGHEVLLVPIYTPTLTDEANVSQDRVFFGGISVYLQQHLGLFRRLPPALDRLWDSRLALKLAARRSIPVDPRLLGELTVSMLKGEDGLQRKEVRKLTGWIRTQPPPDVINLPNSLLSALALPLKKAANRPVCCTLQGEDLFLESLPEPYRAAALQFIRENVAHVDAFIAVSDYYADFMRGCLGIPPEKMHVVRLGINLNAYQPRPPRSSDRQPFTIGYFARVCPEKGLHVLAEAYRGLRHSGRLPAARLEAAGYLAPEHQAYLRNIERNMKEWGLAGEFQYRGVLDREGKIAFLRGLDVLSVPSIYAEPKGMYLLEAMACGVPVVQPLRGAFPEILQRTGGGILVAPEDLNGLGDAIVSLFEDRSLAEELGRRGAAGVREHYSVSAMAARTVEVYRAVCSAVAPQGAPRMAT